MWSSRECRSRSIQKPSLAEKQVTLAVAFLIVFVFLAVSILVKDLRFSKFPQRLSNPINESEASFQLDVGNDQSSHALPVAEQIVKVEQRLQISKG